jgi:hypothetical protein
MPNDAPQHQLINQGFEWANWPGNQAELAQPPTMFQRTQSIVGTAATHTWQIFQAHNWHGGEAKFASYKLGFADSPGVTLVDSSITVG